jgi:hypothetical protein
MDYKKLLILVLCYILMYRTETAHAVTQEPVTVNDIQIKISAYAFIYGIDVDVFSTVLSCENPSHDPKLQSEMKYTRDHPEWGVKKGDRELSYGLSQIHLPTDKSVTYEEATDVDFSLRYMASELSKGHGSRWSCYNLHYKV